MNRLIESIFHLKETLSNAKLKGILPDCPQILTVGRLTYKQQNGVCELLISKYFFNESDFCKKHFFQYYRYFENVP